MGLCDGPENKKIKRQSDVRARVRHGQHKKKKAPYLLWSVPFPLDMSSFSILIKSESRASQDMMLPEVKQEAGDDGGPNKLVSWLTIQLLGWFPLRSVQLDASSKGSSFFSVVSQSDEELGVAALGGPQRNAAFTFGKKVPVSGLRSWVTCVQTAFKRTFTAQCPFLSWGSKEAVAESFLWKASKVDK